MAPRSRNYLAIQTRKQESYERHREKDTDFNVKFFRIDSKPTAPTLVGSKKIGGRDPRKHPEILQLLLEGFATDKNVTHWSEIADYYRIEEFFYP